MPEQEGAAYDGQFDPAREPFVVRPRWTAPWHSSTSTVLGARLVGLAVLVREVLADAHRAIYALVAALIALFWWLVLMIAERIRSHLIFFDGSIVVSNVWEHPQTFKLREVSGLRLCSIRDLWAREPTILFLGPGGAGCLAVLHGSGWRSVDFLAIGKRFGLKIDGAFDQFVTGDELAAKWPAAVSWTQRNPVLAWALRLGLVVAFIVAVILVGNRIG